MAAKGEGGWLCVKAYKGGQKWFGVEVDGPNLVQINKRTSTKRKMELRQYCVLCEKTRQANEVILLSTLRKMKRIHAQLSEEEEQHVFQFLDDNGVWRNFGNAANEALLSLAKKNRRLTARMRTKLISCTPGSNQGQGR